MPLPAAPFTDDYANLLELFDAVVVQCGDVEAFVDGNGPAADRTRAMLLAFRCPRRLSMQLPIKVSCEWAQSPAA